MVLLFQTRSIGSVGEHFLDREGVGGSNPSYSTKQMFITSYTVKSPGTTGFFHFLISLEFIKCHQMAFKMAFNWHLVSHECSKFFGCFFPLFFPSRGHRCSWWSGHRNGQACPELL